jgi:hypothetical protein
VRAKTIRDQLGNGDDVIAVREKLPQEVAVDQNFQSSRGRPSPGFFDESGASFGDEPVGGRQVDDLRTRVLAPDSGSEVQCAVILEDVDVSFGER